MRARKLYLSELLIRCKNKNLVVNILKFNVYPTIQKCIEDIQNDEIWNKQVIYYDIDTKRHVLRIFVYQSESR